MRASLGERQPARTRRLRHAGLAAATALVAVLGYTASGASSATDQTGKFQVAPLAVEADGEPIVGAKSRTGQIAETDPKLLGRGDSTPVDVMVKLDYDSVATYAGGVQGLAATSPKATGKKLKQNKAAVDAYQAHVAGVEQDIVSDIQSAVSGETIRSSYRVAYGGIAMELPANQVDELVSVDGVVAVQQDTLNQPLTSVTPAFTGASAVWPSLGGSARAGEGVIVGVLDTGVFPEHPSFVDPGINHPGGGPYGCQFGVAGDAAFACNDKLIGAYAKTATYLANLNALPGENCINEPTNVCSARDADGHGTHTSSTAVGGPVASAPLFGTNRGPISGMAPGAHLIMYRVCLNQGCFGSDSVSAVDQAILDGVDVLNFSISGGVSAYTDPVELAFLEAYEAGILVNASAGNAGPGAGTANHAGPWTNTVAASTSNRHFFSTLHLTATGGDTLDIAGGVTITAGVSTPTDVVLASAPPYNNLVCNAPAPAGTFTNKIVICERGNTAINGDATGRVRKGFNVSQGGAAGMILYNPAIQQLNSDNHFLPAIHIEGPKAGSTAPAARLLAFLSSHTGVKATWTSGIATQVRGDVVTAFSSRGPLGDFIKPDVTAPGIQILAGHTPDPHDTNIDVGPPGQMFQAIAGTSMSSPHSAGISALVKDAHPDWTPGQIKSALMTSSVQDVLKEDGVTPSDPFDRGAGSIRANRAVGPTVTFDVTAAQYLASAADPLNRIHLNLPSVNANPMPGVVTTTRTMKNVTDTNQVLKVETTAPAGASIDVEPDTVVVNPGETTEIEITINATSLANGQYFGQITLDPNKGGYNNVVLPVAFRKAQGLNSLVHSCSPTTIPVGGTSDCIVEAQNLSPVPAQASLDVSGPQNGQLTIQNVSAPGVPKGPGGNGFTWSGTLTPALAPTIDNLLVPANPPSPGGGYLPLSLFGTPLIAGMTDDALVNFNVPAFTYGSETYTRLGITSNGYVVVGGGTGQDLIFMPQTFPNIARPNNVLAPYWTDLNPPAGAPGSGVRINVLTDGVNDWIVVDWENVPVFTSNAPRSFQMWIGLVGNTPAGDDITFAYGNNIGPGDGASGLNSGAENRDGTSGKNRLPASNETVRVITSPPSPGGKVTITYDAFGRSAGTHDILATLTSNLVQGATTDRETITVTP
jgi:subtilisin family serine protease